MEVEIEECGRFGKFSFLRLGFGNDFNLGVEAKGSTKNNFQVLIILETGGVIYGIV